MTKTDEQKRKGIEKGISSYLHEQKVLLRLIRFKNPLSSKKFDNIFGARRTITDDRGYTTIKMNKIRSRIWNHTPQSILLGGFSGDTELNKWIHLSQLMIKIGLLRVEKKAGEIMYFITQKGRERIGSL